MKLIGEPDGTLQRESGIAERHSSKDLALRLLLERTDKHCGLGADEILRFVPLLLDSDNMKGSRAGLYLVTMMF